jgi:predicted transcriptional regulator
MDVAKEKERWIPIVDWHTWCILRVIEHGELNVRSLIEAGIGSPNTIIDRIEQMIQWGLLKDEWVENGGHRKRVLYITERGKKLLEAFDQIGKIVHQIRGDAR